MKKENQEISWSKNNRNIFEKFAVELREFFETGVYPACGDQDVKYCLELQKKRLDSKKLEMKYEMVPRGHFAQGGGINQSWSDGRYTSTMEYRSCQMTKSFYKNGKELYKKVKNYLFYQIITKAQNKEKIRNNLYSCPNCGAISDVDTLQQGCAYCGTHFKISELFPKVTNYYFIEDVSGTEKEINNSIKKSVFLWMFIFFIVYTLNFSIKHKFSGNFLAELANCVGVSVLSGGIIGYILWAFKKLVSMFGGAVKALPMLFDTVGSRKYFEQKMKEYSPEFSFEYFSAKAVSYLKMLIYSEDARNLPIYTGESIGECTKDIVDTSYTGATALRNFKMQGTICRAKVAVYMESIYDIDGRIKRMSDTFEMTLEKDISVPFDYFFSIKQIQCKDCGDSFDATKQKTCPNCGRVYEIDQEDWIVTKFKKV